MCRLEVAQGTRLRDKSFFSSSTSEALHQRKYFRLIPTAVAWAREGPCWYLQSPVQQNFKQPAARSHCPLCRRADSVLRQTLSSLAAKSDKLTGGPASQTTENHSPT